MLDMEDPRLPPNDPAHLPGWAGATFTFRKPKAPAPSGATVGSALMLFVLLYARRTPQRIGKCAEQIADLGVVALLARRRGAQRPQHAHRLALARDEQVLPLTQGRQGRFFEEIQRSGLALANLLHAR